MGYGHGKRILGDALVAATPFDVPIRVENPILRGAKGRAQVGNGHSHADFERRREVSGIGRVELVRTADANGREGRDDIKGRGPVCVSLHIERSPLFECCIRHKPPSPKHGLIARPADGNDAKLVALESERREVALEGKTGRSGVRIPGFDPCHVGSGDAVAGCVGPAVDTDLHAADPRGVERPPGNAGCSSYNELRCRCIDCADRCGCRLRRGNKMGGRRRVRPVLPGGPGGDSQRRDDNDCRCDAPASTRRLGATWEHYNESASTASKQPRRGSTMPR